jgi:hypothetical protein
VQNFTILLHHEINLNSLSAGGKSSSRKVKEEESYGDADYPPLTGRSATSAVNNSQAPYPPGTASHPILLHPILFYPIKLHSILSYPITPQTLSVLLFTILYGT